MISERSAQSSPPPEVEQAKAWVLCDHASTTSHGLQPEISCNLCGMQWDNRVVEGRQFAIDALIAAVRAESSAEVEKAVRAERSELFCMEHAREWENPGICPICHTGELRSALAAQDEHIARLRKERDAAIDGDPALAAQAQEIETLPPSLKASLDLWRDNPSEWLAEWSRVHQFKVDLIKRAEAAEARLRETPE